MRSVFAEMSVFWKLLGFGCLLVIIFMLVYIIVRRSWSKRKVRSMSDRQQVDKINELAGPFGFYYKICEGIFSSRRDAWQREMGYQELFDRAAVLTGMVIDAQPVYFDYAGRTWLVEFWKGQYGINAGGEVGIYCAESIVPPQEYARTHFAAVQDCEMPIVRSRLFCFCGNSGKVKVLYDQQARHWWLTGFVLGKYVTPKRLVLQSMLEFQNVDMAEAFMVGAGRVQSSYFQAGYGNHCVYAVFGNGEGIPCRQKMLRSIALLWDCLLVRLFLFVTLPFGNPAEQLLFLYYRFPHCLRRLLRFGRKFRRDGGAI